MDEQHQPDTSGRRPNIVVIQADQLAAAALGAYGNPVVQSPHIDALAGAGVVFDRAYCNSPLCAPSRASMMTGRMPSSIGAFDNAADFSTSTPTFAHHLRAAGYHTALVGRMHFIGPDQLHGFEERHTTDVYPAGLDMVPDWELQGSERLQWYHDTDSVFTAGASVATVQRDFDDEVIFRTLRHLTDRARAGDAPFLLVASFIHPHDPYEPPVEHWRRYDGVEIDDPAVPPLLPEKMDPHSRRLLEMCGFDQKMPSPEEVRNARRAYYAAVSYVDDHVGRIVARLEELGLRENTVVILTSDHGDMLGERGLWYKMSPFEQSARVPLIISAPGRLEPRRVAEPVSLIDLLPTLVELSEAEPAETEGRSVVGLSRGEAAPSTDVVIEYLAEGLAAPQITLVRGSLKLVVCPGDPDQLYDLATDPDELHNLAGESVVAQEYAELRGAIAERYDLDRLADDVRGSQRQRRFVQGALARGATVDWDYEPSLPSPYVRGDFWTAIARGRIPSGEGASK